MFTGISVIFQKRSDKGAIYISVIALIWACLSITLLTWAQHPVLQKEKPHINEFYYWVYSYPPQKQQPFNYGFEAMSAIERLPLLFPSGTQTKQFISYDATGANTDGDFLHSFTKYIDSKGEHVIFDEYGPGCLYRQQMNVWYNFIQSRKRFPQAGKAKIRYYFDDEKNPRIDCTLDELYRSDSSIFSTPFRFMDKTSRFAIAYHPLSFDKRLKVTVKPDTSWDDRWTTWYQYTYLTYPQSTKILSWKEDRNAKAKVNAQWTNAGRDPKDTNGNEILDYALSIAKGDSSVIFLDKPGSMTSLHIQLEPYNEMTFNHIQLKLFWDDQKEAAIDVPLGYFFGGGGKDFSLKKNAADKEINVSTYTLETLLFGFNGKDHTFYSYWPMPFWKNARMVLVNNAGIDVNNLTCKIGLKPKEVYSYPEKHTGYFYAKRTLDTAWQAKPYARAFEETGRGHVTGITFYSNNYDMDSDEFTYMDDSQTPQIHGDGTEDDHNQGWGGSAFQEPLWGGLINGFQGAYRIYLNDAYIFNKNINIRYEYEKVSSFSNTRTDVLIYYYKSPFADTLKLTDEMDVGNLQSESTHHYKVRGEVWNRTLQTCYDGYSKAIDYYKLEDDGRAFSKSSSFTVNIAPDNGGVRLRRRIYRKDNGVQTAWVYVNGKKLAKPWHIVTNASAPEKQIYVINKRTVIKSSDLENQGWFDSDYEIPVKYTKGKSSIRLNIVIE